MIKIFAKCYCILFGSTSARKMRYAGSDHAYTVEKFYRELGLTGDMLPQRGLIGKDLGEILGGEEMTKKT